MKDDFTLFYLFFADSETTEDEGDQFETKEDSGDVEDQAVHTGIHLGFQLAIIPLDNFGFSFISVLIVYSIKTFIDINENSEMFQSKLLLICT